MWAMGPGRMMFPAPPLPDDCYKGARSVSAESTDPIEHDLLAGKPSRNYGRVNSRVRAGRLLVGVMTCC